MAETGWIEDRLQKVLHGWLIKTRWPSLVLGLRLREDFFFHQRLAGGQFPVSNRSLCGDSDLFRNIALMRAIVCVLATMIVFEDGSPETILGCVRRWSEDGSPETFGELSQTRLFLRYT